MPLQKIDYDLQIVCFGDDLMGLFEKGSPDRIVTATRGEQQWLVHADGRDDVTVDTRAEAITAMTTHALAVLPGDGYSVLIPPGLKTQP